MSHSSPSDQSVRDLVSQADRLRRARAAAGQLRLAPMLAGLALAVALIGRLAGWPVWLGPSVLGAGLLALAVTVLVMGRRRPTTDAIAASVDRDAALAGELRSAHWFESQGADGPWAAYHVGQAGEHARSVDWRALYARERSPKLWALTALASVAVIALAVRMPRAAATAEGVALVEAGEPGAELSPELQKKLAMLMAQFDEAAAAGDIGDMPLADLEDLMAQLDPAMRAKLAEMLEKRAQAGDAKAGSAQADQRPDRAENSAAGLPEDVRWALENMAARMAQSSDDRQTAADNPAASTESGEMGMGSPQAQAETNATASQVAAPMVRESATDPGTTMMMGGGGPMGGDSRPGAGGNTPGQQGTAEALLVAQALRKELVEANADALGENVDKEDLRRKTEQGKSGLGFTRVAGPQSVEPSRSSAPPPVPEARRQLLLNYFIRRQ